MTYAHRCDGREPVRLAAYDPDDTAGLTREQAEARLEELGEELNDLQELLYAAGRHALLVILQGLDTSGKDGTIRSVFRYVDAQGCRVEAFKPPTPVEADHDFLWRVHQVAPRRGMIGVFNRSHYEDVLVARVHSLVPAEVWRRRYQHINAFERLLLDSGTLLVKCYLHISKAEQEARLLDRERDVAKAWKLSAADWLERRAWEEYIAAYEEVFRRCSSRRAPWHIVPANKKWFRNLAVAELLVEALRPYRAGWLQALRERGERELAAIQAARQAGRRQS
jgi:PPK2 family polyphosphate:nucleotide phosphotransferase